MNSRDQPIPAQLSRGPASRFQFGLRSTLTLLLIVGLVCGWYVDRRAFQARLRKADTRIVMQDFQIEELKARLDLMGRSSPGMTLYFWASTNEFIEMLHENEDDNSCTNMMSSFAKTGNLEELMRRVPELLQDPNARTRERTITVLRFSRHQRPAALQPFLSQVVAELTNCLDDEDPEDRVRGSAIYALGFLGADASPALPKLQELLADDNFWFNSSAADAISKIDPSVDVTTRLIELIDKQPRNWQQSASVLARCGDPERAREYLSKLYAEAETEADQKQIVSWLNEIRGENEHGDGS